MSGDFPLSGIKVLDLSAYIAGPYGCNLLADMGAEVIKVEPPEGDNLRKYPSTLPDESRAFLGVNRGKQGICLDLKSEQGYEVFIRLAREADVIVHNFRPSVPPRLRIDYDTLRELNPRLVYCSLTGYGQSGPLASRAGYDQVLQARTGICASQGTPEQPQIVYGSVVDYYGAAMLANGVTAALFQRERTGAGQHVCVSLLSSALAMQAARLVVAENEPRDINRDMRSGGITGIHPTREGHLYISANTPHFWRALCQLIGLSELAENERYDTVKKRAAHVDELVPMLREALQAKSAAEWEALFGDQVPCSVVRKVEDVFEDAQVQEQGLVGEHEHPAFGRYKTIANPISFGQAGARRQLRSAPGLGQHSRELMRELGYTEAEIEKAIADKGVLA
ncbi:CaiB/BaiF CoA-transferase family protein [Bordetella sp. 15P40C-2]|uniref:CaiB/BaiF CoA transferase family protein n=1 Tax=Bordetella sp. 15P40C-2 TaxID=2572246 RepID=UPI001320A491|nr:CoA transferase [Bordetella sp. 15P40C-2]MVW70354.1 CoA transferase [Bordetella sp. 15P40C-2]